MAKPRQQKKDGCGEAAPPKAQKMFAALRAANIFWALIRTHFTFGRDIALRLDRYTTGSYTVGASIWKQLLWFFIGAPLVRSYLIPFSGLKVNVLRWFGAEIGRGVRIKTGVRVKFPWRLVIKDFVWIGEDAWFDSLDLITIESHCCISQGVYLCTGNHDWSDRDFALKTAPIYIESGSWIAARATVAAGVRVGQGAVLGLGSVATRSLEPMTIYSGNPAIAIKARQIRDS